MKEEEAIRKRCGAANPFRTPEGYFEQFTSNLMNQLPERTTITKTVGHKRLLQRVISYAAAAVICGAMILGSYRISISQHQEKEVAHSEVPSSYSEEIYMENMLDYAMVSNHEIAQYLTDVY